MVRIESSVVYECDRGIATMTLNRPDQINAFNVAMRDDLYQMIRLFNDDPTAKVAIIKGSGPKGFCAGADLSEFGTAPSQVIARSVRWERDLWGMFLSIRKPVIASLHGYVIGSGIEIAALCDIRVAADNCQFRMPEVALGMIPAAGGTQTLARLVGVARALDMILTNKSIGPIEAKEIGLIDRIVPICDIELETQAIADSLTLLDQNLLHSLKRSVLDGGNLPLSEALLLEARIAEILNITKT